MNSGRHSPRADWTLRCDGLHIRRGGREVLRGVNLTLRHGECLALIGPNGAGKTTLMLAMLGLLPPASGRIELDGRAVHRIPPRQRGRWSSYVPQGLDSITGFSVYDVVAAGRFPHVAPLAPLGRADLDIIERALALSGLRELAGRPIAAVSGGERQKTLIAAAIAQDADAMFLDEPNTALDPAYQIELVRLLRDWHAGGRGLVLISHDLQLPAALECRIVALRDGQVVADGMSRDVLEPGRLREIYGAEFDAVQTATGSRIVVPRF